MSLFKQQRWATTVRIYIIL